jgi:hypothetical protein
MNMKIGITERGDAGLDHSWINKQELVDGLILISKNPALIPLNEINKPFIIHCTITGYGGTRLEPNVPKSEQTLETYWQLVKQYDSHRIVLRVDPIILKNLQSKMTAHSIISQTKGRVRISFLDKYAHAINRITKAGIRMKPSPFHYPLEQRESFISSIPLPVEICGEPGLPCTGCISKLDLKAMNLNIPESQATSSQRKDCACLIIKTELLERRGQCKHGCLYCYWK